MSVAMVKVGPMRVDMLEAVMAVGVGGRLGSLVALVIMVMVVVVDVPVVMLHRLVDVDVSVLRPDQKPGSGDHEGGARGGPKAGDLAQERPGQSHREARGGGE